MSKSFTTPAGQTWQTLLTEITRAYSERRQAISQSAYVPIDRTVQSSAYWRTLQGWLETNCTSFIDHVNGPLTVDGTAFLYFTLETWRAAAGLNVNGFRRSPLTGGTAYGQMQIGDAIGPWIFEDIQKGFGALRWLPFFTSIVNVRSVFPVVTGMASFVGSGTGVYYTYPDGLLGGSGTYNILLDTRRLQTRGDQYYIALGAGAYGSASSDGGGIILDTGFGTAILSYSASLTFSDPVNLVQVYGVRLVLAGGTSGHPVVVPHTESFSNSSASVSAMLDTEGEAVASFEFYPVIKVPFTNQ